MEDCTQVIDISSIGCQISDLGLERIQVGSLIINETPHNIYKGETVIGRDVMSDIRLQNNSISSRHAVLEVEDWDTHLIYDCGSTNRTRMGKIILKPNIRYNLQDGEELMFADIKAKYIKLEKSQEKHDDDDCASDAGSESILSSAVEDEDIVSDVSNNDHKAALQVQNYMESNANVSRMSSDLNDSSLIEKQKASTSKLHVVDASEDDSTDDEVDFIPPSQTVKEFASKKQATATRKCNNISGDIFGIVQNTKSIEINSLNETDDSFNTETMFGDKKTVFKKLTNPEVDSLMFNSKAPKSLNPGDENYFNASLEEATQVFNNDTNSQINDSRQSKSPGSLNILDAETEMPIAPVSSDVEMSDLVLSNNGLVDFNRSVEDSKSSIITNILSNANRDNVENCINKDLVMSVKLERTHDREDLVGNENGSIEVNCRNHRDEEMGNQCNENCRINNMDTSTCEVINNLVKVVKQEQTEHSEINNLDLSDMATQVNVSISGQPPYRNSLHVEDDDMSDMCTQINMSIYSESEKKKNVKEEHCSFGPVEIDNAAELTQPNVNIVEEGIPQQKKRINRASSNRCDEEVSNIEAEDTQPNLHLYSFFTESKLKTEDNVIDVQDNPLNTKERSTDEDINSVDKVEVHKDQTIITDKPDCSKTMSNMDICSTVGDVMSTYVSVRMSPNSCKKNLQVTTLMNELDPSKSKGLPHDQGNSCQNMNTSFTFNQPCGSSTPILPENKKQNTKMSNFKTPPRRPVERISESPDLPCSEELIALARATPERVKCDTFSKSDEQEGNLSKQEFKRTSRTRKPSRKVSDTLEEEMQKDAKLMKCDALFNKHKNIAERQDNDFEWKLVANSLANDFARDRRSKAIQRSVSRKTNDTDGEELKSKRRSSPDDDVSNINNSMRQTISLDSTNKVEEEHSHTSLKRTIREGINKHDIEDLSEKEKSEIKRSARNQSKQEKHGKSIKDSAESKAQVEVKKSIQNEVNGVQSITEPSNKTKLKSNTDESQKMRTEVNDVKIKRTDTNNVNDHLEKSTRKRNRTRLRVMPTRFRSKDDLEDSDSSSISSDTGPSNKRRKARELPTCKEVVNSTKSKINPKHSLHTAPSSFDIKNSSDSSCNTGPSSKKRGKARIVLTKKESNVEHMNSTQDGLVIGPSHDANDQIKISCGTSPNKRRKVSTLEKSVDSAECKNNAEHPEYSLLDANNENKINKDASSNTRRKGRAISKFEEPVGAAECKSNVEPSASSLHDTKNQNKINKGSSSSISRKGKAISKFEDPVDAAECKSDVEHSESSLYDPKNQKKVNKGPSSKKSLKGIANSKCEEPVDAAEFKSYTEPSESSLHDTKNKNKVNKGPSSSKSRKGKAISKFEDPVDAAECKSDVEPSESCLHDVKNQKKVNKGPSSNKSRKGRANSKCEEAVDAAECKSNVEPSEATLHDAKNQSETFKTPILKHRSRSRTKGYEKSRSGSRSNSSQGSQRSDTSLPPSPRRSVAKGKCVLFTSGLANPSLESQVKKLGGSVVDSPMDCSLLVADKVRRTVKFLCVLGQGKPIVSLDWLTQSRRCSSFTEPMDNLLVDKEAEAKFQFNLAQTIQSARNQPLLKGFKIHATPSVKPPPKEIRSIVECCGGEYFEKMPSKWSENTIIVSHLDDKSLWKKYKVKGQTPPIVASEMLLIGVLQHKLNIDPHRIS